MAFQKFPQMVSVNRGIIEVAQMAGLGNLDVLGSRNLRHQVPGKPFATVAIEFAVEHERRFIKRCKVEFDGISRECRRFG